MANAQGGVIVYGIREEEQTDGRRLAVEATPIMDGGTRDRLEAILESAVSPSMNLATKQIEDPDGGYFLIVKIQQRTGPPHMVTSYGEHRHYIRRGPDRADGAA